MNRLPDGAQSTEPATAGEEASGGYVVAFGRGLAVLGCFSRARSVLTIAEVARATDLSRATARRFLYTLEAEGYVNNDGGRFSLRPRALELGYAYLSSTAVDDRLQARLEELAERSQQSCSAGVLDGREVVFVARAETAHPRVMTLALKVGDRVPAHLTALGRVLMAELSDDDLETFLRTLDDEPTGRAITGSDQLREEIITIRQAGYCVTDQEVGVDIRAAAVPVRRVGKPPLAISIAAHASQQSLETMSKIFVDSLREAAEKIENLTRG